MGQSDFGGREFGSPLPMAITSTPGDNIADPDLAVSEFNFFHIFLAVLEMALVVIEPPAKVTMCRSSPSTRVSVTSCV